MPLPPNPTPFRWKDHRRALSWTLPVVGTAAVLAYPPDFAAFVFHGGARVLVYNLALAAFVPALFLVMLALGGSWRRIVRVPAGHALARADELVLGALAGSALLSLAGFALGALGLLWPIVAALLLSGVLYWALLRDPRAIPEAGAGFRAWLAAAELPRGDPATKRLRSLVVPVRLLALAVVAAMALVRAVYFDADNTDVVQFYIPYLEEIRRQHGIWIAADRPIYLDFLNERGNGVYLLGAALANGLVGHAVSSAYFLLLALLVRRLVARALPGDGATAASRGAGALLPDLAVLSMAAALLDDFTFGKFYLQTSAWFLALLYGGLLYVAAERGARSGLARLLIPLVLALPISLPQYQAIATAILALAAAGLALKGEPAADRRLLELFGLGAAACLASLGLNWIYIGIPDIVPYWFFEKFINASVFERFTSQDVQTYTNYIQGYTSSFLNLYPSTAAPATMPSALHGRASGLVQAGEAVLVAGLLGGLAAVIRMARLTAAADWPLLRAALAAVLLAALALLDASDAHDGSALLGLGFSGLVLGLVAAAGAGLAVAIADGRPPFGRPFDRGAGLFGAGLVGYLLIAALAVLFVRSGSLERLMRPAEALVPAAGLILSGLLIRWMEGADAAEGHPTGAPGRGPALAGAAVVLAVAIFGALHARAGIERSLPAMNGIAIVWLAMAIGGGAGWLLGERLRRCGQALLETVTALAVLLAATALAREASQHPPGAILRYLAGLEGREASSASPRGPFDKCLELARAVPGPAPVLHLNGYTSMSYCMLSPLLPRNKLVHQYESAFARRFRDTVLAPPERAREVLRSLGIDYFLVEKGSIDFWAPGLEALTRAEALPRYFDLYAETPSFIILTWRGEGRGAPSPATVAAIERWRRIGLQRAGFMVGDVLLGHWRALLWMGMPRPAYPWGSTIDFGEGGDAGYYLERGWSSPDASGTWTSAPEAELVLDADTAPAGGGLLTVTSGAFTPPEHPIVDATVVANGTPVGHWLFVAGQPERPHTLLIPAEALRGQGPLRLVLRFEDLKSPRELGLSSDWRPLGMLVHTLRLGDPQAPAAPIYRLGGAIDFTKPGAAEPYLGEGWLDAEPAGTWTVGPDAELRLTLADPPAGDGVLAISAAALTAPERPAVTATVSVNGRVVGTLRFGESAQAAERTLPVPHALLAAPGSLVIAFKLDDTRPPAGLGIAPDPRPLGLQLRSLRLEAQ